MTSRLAGCCLTLLTSAMLVVAADFQSAQCEGTYKRHLQGFATDDRTAIYWCWTDALVKTDLQGHILKKIDVAIHHGDLCYHNGKVYVAVNLGKFNEPAGKADSWVYVYDADTLAELARHPVQEVVHGAGGMAYRNGKFFIIGGLPVGVNENYVYEYDDKFVFKKRHTLASGYTLMGIQTIAWGNNAWWFGCYGKPRVLLRADSDLKFTGKWNFDASYGIAVLPDGRFLIGTNTLTKGIGWTGKVVFAHEDKDNGLVLDQPQPR